MRKYESALLRETYTSVRHASGLEVLWFPKRGFVEKTAILAARFGAVNAAFLPPDGAEPVRVPDGTAHFLEHKLFENEEGSAFEAYAKTGAQANAFTSFSRTAYYFTCTDGFHESLDVLLGFVRRPWFTAASVAKEQGIIGQEIRMYEDSPYFRAMYDALEALYAENEVRRDIAGTVESIAQITPETLYACYDAFYNPGNMVLCVCGDVELDAVLRQVDRHFPEPGRPCAKPLFTEEPAAILRAETERVMPVETPLLMGALKSPRCGLSGREFLRESVLFELCLEILCGPSSPFYREFFEQGLINGSFSADYNGAASYSFCLFSCGSPRPEAVFDGLLRHMEQLAAQGLPAERFERCRRVLIGEKTALYNSVEAIANELILWYFMNGSPFEEDELLRALTLPELEAFFRERFRRDRMVRSIVRPPQPSV